MSAQCDSEVEVAEHKLDSEQKQGSKGDVENLRVDFLLLSVLA